eukprot:760900-Hanusia_phi.AAC.1
MRFTLVFWLFLILQPFLAKPTFVTYDAATSFPICSNFTSESNLEIGFLFAYVEDGVTENKNISFSYLPLNATCQCTSRNGVRLNFSVQTLDIYNAVLAFLQAGTQQNLSHGYNETTSNGSSNMSIYDLNMSMAEGSTNATFNTSSTSSSNLTSNSSSVANVSARSLEGWGRKPGRVLTSIPFRLLNISCLSRSDAEALCKQLNIANNYCPSVGETVIVVQKNIVVINNITKVVVQAAINSDFATALQKEIAAFLTSFSSSTFFIGSNIGIGKAANIVLWLGFFIFLAAAILL